MKRYIFILSLIFLATSCSEDWLKPDPLSFYSPENVYADKNSFVTILNSCLKSNRNEFYGEEWNGNDMPQVTEHIFSEISVDAMTDNSGAAMDLAAKILPDGDLSSFVKIEWLWTESYKRIKNANIIISRIEDVEWANAEERNNILGKAYFHRARTYYRLVHQFGDVPLILNEINEPKTDFYSVTRKSILQKCKKDLEFAAQWVEAEQPIGDINKATVNHLLTKVNLSLLLFDDAIASATSVIDDGYHHLMTERFGVDKDDPDHDIIWDLHQSENKISPENRESIYVLVSNEQYPDNGASIKTLYGRMLVPFWSITGGIKTPTGLNGMSQVSLGGKDGSGIVEYDMVSKYQRGIGKCRPSNYAQYEIWEDGGDLRHKYPNWVRMEDLVYNHPELKTVEDPYYGKNLQLYDENDNILVNDTIRNWFGWPYYKVIYPDPNPYPWTYGAAGGHGNVYCYRLAETYLLRAEAYFWKDNLSQAAYDLNMVRTRAGCSPLTVSEINIGTIFDERARELFMEEPRKTELTRVAFILSETGKTYDGRSYSLDNFSQENFWYDRVYEKNNFYRENITTQFMSYRIAPHLVLWPIPAHAINANSTGHINQNKGYPSNNNYETPWKWIDGEGEGEIVKQE